MNSNSIYKYSKNLVIDVLETISYVILIILLKRRVLPVYEKIVIFNTLLYSVWCFYFCHQLLIERLSPFKSYLCILFTHIILIIGGYSLLPDNVPFIFVHLASFLCIALLHSDSIKKKLFAYFLYTCTIMLMETLIMCLYVSIKKIIFHQNSGFISMNSVTTPVDALILYILMLTAGSIMCKKLSDLIAVFVHSYSIIPLTQILFPFYWLCIFLSLLCNSQHKISGYFLIVCGMIIPVIPVFIRGLHNIRIQEQKRIFHEKQITFLKEQLLFFDAIETEYQNLRKWNHDVENHMLSLNYLMKAGKYEEADKYLHNILPKSK